MPVLLQLQCLAQVLFLAVDPIFAETETTPVAQEGLVLAVYAALILKRMAWLLVIGTERKAQDLLVLAILPHHERKVRRSVGRVA